MTVSLISRGIRFCSRTGRAATLSRLVCLGGIRSTSIRARSAGWKGSAVGWHSRPPRTADVGLGFDLVRHWDPQVVLGPDTHGTSVFGPPANTKYRFHALYHPYAAKLVSFCSREGLDRTLRREVQRDPYRSLSASASAPADFQGLYGPSPELVATPHPSEEMDFSFSGAYSSYNWELFFHAPMLIADRLAKNQRFEEALHWYHYIFDPTDTSDAPRPARYWQTKEFFEKSSEEYQQDRLSQMFDLLARAHELRDRVDPTPAEQQDLRRLDDLEASIKAWRTHPFEPHLVARMRTTAYQKCVVMKYVDTLVAWGDQFFAGTRSRPSTRPRRSTCSRQAFWAGARSKPPPGRHRRWKPSTRCRRAWTISPTRWRRSRISYRTGRQHGRRHLRAAAADDAALLSAQERPTARLLGHRRRSPLQDPALHEHPGGRPSAAPRRASHRSRLAGTRAAAGMDLTQLLSAVVPVPGYRFSVLAQKASELANEVRALGSMLLATLEKRDAEALSLLRSTQEMALLGMVERIRQRQLDEAAEQVNALSASRHVLVGRLSHYQRLLGESEPKVPGVGQHVPDRDRPRFSDIQNPPGVKMFPHEILENVLLAAGQRLEEHSAAQSVLSAVLHAIPDINAMPMGVGTSVRGIGQVVGAAATATSSLARSAQFAAGLTGRLGSYVVRELDWVLQHNQTARELAQIDKQILAAEIRLEIAGHELGNHRRQMENAREVDAFMRDKYRARSSIPGCSARSPASTFRPISSPMKRRSVRSMPTVTSSAPDNPRS